MKETLVLVVKKQIYQWPALTHGCSRAWRDGKAFPFGEAVRMKDCPSGTACGPAQSQEPLPHMEELVYSVTVTNETLEIA